MFNSIQGRLSEKRADAICVETSGVEWELSVPARSVDDFGRVGDEVRAFTWLHHYEDGMRLFAFPSAAERAVFLELMKVEGIGPKQALKILSGIRPDALEAALDGDDLAALQRIPGVGPKLAQKMVLALKGRLVRDTEGGIDSRDEAQAGRLGRRHEGTRGHGLRPQGGREGRSEARPGGRRRSREGARALPPRLARTFGGHIIHGSTQEDRS